MNSDKACIKPRIGVLLVNYRQWDLTRKCIGTLRKAEQVEMVIALVDNASPEPVPEWVEKVPDLLFHRNDTNAGLTAGNNLAFEMVAGRGVDYVFILNNDTEVSPSTPAVLAEYLETHRETGIAAPAISFASDPDRIWSAGGRFSRWRMRLDQMYSTVNDLPGEPVEMEQVTGCAMMLRTEDYRDSGMQDPDLFVYYEDTDLCFRIKKSGKSIMLIPNTCVLHHVSISVGGVFSPFAVYFTHRNRYIVAARSLGPAEMAMFLLYYVFVTMMKTVLYPLRGTPELLRWMWLGMLHGLAGKAHLRPAALFRRPK